MSIAWASLRGQPSACRLAPRDGYAPAKPFRYWAEPVGPLVCTFPVVELVPASDAFFFRFESEELESEDPVEEPDSCEPVVESSFCFCEGDPVAGADEGDPVVSVWFAGCCEAEPVEPVAAEDPVVSVLFVVELVPASDAFFFRFESEEPESEDPVEEPDSCEPVVEPSFCFCEGDPVAGAEPSDGSPPTCFFTVFAVETASRTMVSVPWPWVASMMTPLTTPSASSAETIATSTTLRPVGIPAFRLRFPACEPRNALPRTAWDRADPDPADAADMAEARPPATRRTPPWLLRPLPGMPEPGTTLLKMSVAGRTAPDVRPSDVCAPGMAVEEPDAERPTRRAMPADLAERTWPKGPSSEPRSS